MKVRNLFWREGSSLKYYVEYGDCVSFDTTYMTNKYNLPFAPFCGVTGHGHTCMFGCAFMSDEKIETFVWIFETFLESMGGKHPRSIITYQDKAMRAAIKQVMPDARHRIVSSTLNTSATTRTGIASQQKKVCKKSLKM